MPNYAIIRVEKHTSLGTIAGIGHHLDRTRETPNAVAERMPLNRTWHGQHWINWSAEPPVPGGHLTAFQERLADFQTRGGTIQKNAVLALEVLTTASPEAFLRPDFDLDAWADAQADYVAKRFGKNNIVSLVLHLDEETPHVHAIVIPEIQRIENRGNKKSTKPTKPKPPKPALAASQWVGGRALLSELQSDYAADMAQFGLERGKERSGARHVPVSAYYAQGEALVTEVELLRAENERLRVRNAELGHELLDAAKEMKGAAIHVQDLEDRLAESDALAQSRGRCIETLSDQVTSLQQRAAAAETELSELDADLQMAFPQNYQKVLDSMQRCRDYRNQQPAPEAPDFSR